MKRATNGIRAMAMLAAMVVGASQASADTETVGGVTWGYTVTNDTATVTNASPVEGALAIPAELGGYPVTGIGSNAFWACQELTDVTFPVGVTNIGEEAFGWCTGLTCLTIPGSVATIEWQAFFACHNLKEVVVENGVKTISTYVFYDCLSLERVSFPDTLSWVGRGAFYQCGALARIEVPGFWKDAGMLDDANVPDGCEVVYRGLAEAGEDDGVEIAVTDVAAKQRYPWNGLVDIDFKLECSEPTTTLYLYAIATDGRTGKGLPVKTVKLEGGEFGDELVVRAVDLNNGKARLVWNAGLDVEGTVSDAVTVEVQAFVKESAPYLVVDLSEGSGDGAVYPTSCLGGVPVGGWGEEFKTTKLVLRRIPAGTFMMGSPAKELGRFENETQHPVTLTRPFYIGVFEVTQRQWELVMGTRPSFFSNPANTGTLPVESVSYDDDIRGRETGWKWPESGDVDAGSFMGRMRARASGFQWDLPTEAQWEYACRAGTGTALNSGKNLTDEVECGNMAEVGRYGKNSDNCTGEVGMFRPNAWGLYDMHGNVYEFCLDWLQGSMSISELGSNPATDPKGPGSENARLRVRRGGCWYDSANRCRSAYRINHVVNAPWEKCTGFRLAAVVPRMTRED